MSSWPCPMRAPTAETCSYRAAGGWRVWSGASAASVSSFLPARERPDGEIWNCSAIAHLRAFNIRAKFGRAGATWARSCGMLALLSVCLAASTVAPGIVDGPAYSVQLMTGAIHPDGSEPVCAVFPCGGPAQQIGVPVAHLAMGRVHSWLRRRLAPRSRRHIAGRCAHRGDD